MTSRLEIASRLLPQLMQYHLSMGREVSTTRQRIDQALTLAIYDAIVAARDLIDLDANFDPVRPKRNANLGRDSEA